MKAKTKTKQVSWDLNVYIPQNNGVTKAVSSKWWSNFNSELYDRLMIIKHSK